MNIKELFLEARTRSNGECSVTKDEDDARLDQHLHSSTSPALPHAACKNLVEQKLLDSLEHLPQCE